MLTIHDFPTTSSLSLEIVMVLSYFLFFPFNPWGVGSGFSCDDPVGIIATKTAIHTQMVNKLKFLHRHNLQFSLRLAGNVLFFSIPGFCLIYIFLSILLHVCVPLLTCTSVFALL